MWHFPFLQTTQWLGKKVVFINLICHCLHQRLSGMIQAGSQKKLDSPLCALEHGILEGELAKKRKKVWVEILTLLCSETSRKITVSLSHHFIMCPVRWVEMICIFYSYVNFCDVRKKVILWDSGSEIGIRHWKSASSHLLRAHQEFWLLTQLQAEGRWNENRGMAGSTQEVTSESDTCDGKMWLTIVQRKI